MTPTPPLSPRETEVLALYLSGYRPVEIASKLGMIKQTVDSYLRQCREKYGYEHNHAMVVDLCRRAA